MANEWFYFRNEQQIGPVTSAQLKQLAAAGELLPADLIWKEGMAEWIAASGIRGLFAQPAPGAAPVGVQPTAATQQGGPIEYYNPTGAWGSRAAVTLRGFPPPTGKADHWPLSEDDLRALTKAESFRRRIRALTVLFQVLFALGLLACCGLMLLLMLGSMTGGKISVVGAVTIFWGVGRTVLLFFSARANRVCSLWPSIIWMILFSIEVLSALAMLIFGFDLNGPTREISFFPVVTIVLNFVFICLCVAAYGAIPRFLKCPVWTQEALVHAKL